MSEQAETAENWRNLRVSKVVRLIRRYKQEGRVEELPLEELYASDEKYIRNELLKRLDYTSYSCWERVGFQSLLSSNKEEAAKTFKNLPKPGSSNYNAAVYLGAIDAVLHADKADEAVIAGLIEKESKSSLTVNALIQKSPTAVVCQALIKSSACTVEALNYILDRISGRSVSSTLPFSKEFQQIVRDDSSLTYRNFLKVYRIFFKQGAVSLPNLMSSESDNCLKAYKEGLLLCVDDSKPNVFSWKADDPKASAELQFYTETFRTDEDWEPLLKLGFSRGQKALIADYAKKIQKQLLIDRDAEFEVRKQRLLEKVNLTNKAQEVFTEYALRDETCQDRIVSLLAHIPELFSRENLRTLLHQLTEKNLFTVLDQAPTVRKRWVPLAEQCCSTDLTSCPTWKAAYRWRYAVKGPGKNKFEKFRNEAGDKFFPFAITVSTVSQVKEKDINSFISYAETGNLENMPECEKTTYALLKNFI